jgi:hypothetical protein
MRAIKKDKFSRSRGGIYKILSIVCVACGQEVLVYQKDGSGYLHRAYLNRILAPEKFAKLQDTAKSTKDLPNLICQCGKMIGVPMLHSEGRMAFRLVLGTIVKLQNRL